MKSLFKALVGICVLFLFIFFINTKFNSYYREIFNIIGINIILVASLSISNGFTGLFSLGHAGFMAVGAYTSALLDLPLDKKAMLLPDLPYWLGHISLPFFPSVVIAGFVAAFFALLIGYPVLRLKGHYLSVATLGFMVIVRVLINNTPKLTRGAIGINNIPNYTNIWWVYFWVVVTIYVLWRIVNSSYGRAFLAIREDYIAASLSGINLTKYKIFSFTIGAFFAGIAGALWAHQITAITPRAFSFVTTFNIVVMLVIGGMGSLSGSIISAFLLTLLPELMRPLEEGLVIFGYALPQLYGLTQLILAGLLILVMIFRPKGIMGDREIKFNCFFWKKV